MQDIKAYRYQLPMTLASIPVREGLVISCKNDHGDVIWHEIAPLPNWSSESLDAVIGQWHNIKDHLFSLSPNEAHNLPKSLIFAIQSLSLFPTYDPSPVSVCGHLMGTASQMAKDAEILASQGCSVVKVKVGSLNAHDAKALIKDLSLAFFLRIDTNQAWDIKQAESILSGVSKEKIDYVEDPFYSASDLQSFSFPFALDETLRKDFPSFIEELPNFKAIVIKPTMQGVFDEKSPLFQMAKKRNLEIVLSSSFETSIGIYQIARLSKHLKLTAPMGIGTYRYFAEDILQTPLCIEEGRLIFPTHMQPKWNYLIPL